MVAIAPELLWRVPELLGAIDELIAGLGDERFVAQLPHLRLAFSALNPRETDEVVARIAHRHGAGGEALQAPVVYGIGEEELRANLGLSEKVRASLHVCQGEPGALTFPPRGSDAGSAISRPRRAGQPLLLQVLLDGGQQAQEHPDLARRDATRRGLDHLAWMTKGENGIPEPAERCYKTRCLLGGTFGTSADSGPRRRYRRSLAGIHPGLPGP
jgi:hypothetical protein